ncbi:MAG TPA: hypothetical protein VHL50_11160, partial [Pyrinomonadaceae bacterium]|nr:hypothetical protein [Pyrinomonadaceae bacterium]
PNFTETDLCRDLAYRAAVTRSYHIVWNPELPSSADETAATLEEASARLLVNPGSTLRVYFDWSFGDQRGRDWIDYSVSSTMATQHFVERIVDHLVAKRIADSIYRGLLWQSEHDDPIEVVEWSAHSPKISKENVHANA